jgi:hypothetical protein
MDIGNLAGLDLCQAQPESNVARLSDRYVSRFSQCYVCLYLALFRQCQFAGMTSDSSSCQTLVGNVTMAIAAYFIWNKAKVSA